MVERGHISAGAACWLVEEGIGEQRAIRIEGDAIIAARIAWPGEIAAGHVEDALLVSRAAGSRRGTARLANGEEVLVSSLPRDAGEGAPIRIEVTRAAMAEAGRIKRAHARPSDAPPAPAPDLASRLRRNGETVRTVHRFPAPGWDDLIAEATAGTVEFAGGSLSLTPTPAMTLIDIDGAAEPRFLALAAVPPIAAALRRFAIGGSIGIDFPTLPDRADRRAVDDALQQALDGWPHERTAMNGFGFVQIVTRLEAPSILHRLAAQPCGAAARLLLRRAEGVAGAGAILVTAHPQVIARIIPQWREELARRTGRETRWQGEAGLAPLAGFAQSVA